MTYLRFIIAVSFASLAALSVQAAEAPPTIETHLEALEPLRSGAPAPVAPTPMAAPAPYVAQPLPPAAPEPAPIVASPAPAPVAYTAPPPPGDMSYVLDLASPSHNAPMYSAANEAEKTITPGEMSHNPCLKKPAYKKSRAHKARAHGHKKSHRKHKAVRATKKAAKAEPKVPEADFITHSLLPPPPAPAAPTPPAAMPVPTAPAPVPAPKAEGGMTGNDDAQKPAAPVTLSASPSAALPPPPAPPASTVPQPAAPAPAADSTPPALRIAFAPDDTTVSPDMRAQLDTLTARLKQDETIRVSVVAHAAGTGDQASVARRTSLARALAVRAYLIDQGVDNLRINVQAEGSRDAGTQPDRVDVFLLSPVKG